MHVKVKFVEGFKDGTIFPKAFAAGEIVVMTQAQLAQVERSGGVVEVIENVIPNPLKAQKVENDEPNDPQNPDNEINDLKTHVPGTEDEVEQVREKEAGRKKKK